MAQAPGGVVAENDEDTRECPYCKEEIKAEAIKCKHCGSRLSPEQPAHGGVCPYCKEDIKPDAVKCKHCKSNLAPMEAGGERRGDCDCKGSEEDGGYSRAMMRGSQEGFETLMPGHGSPEMMGVSARIGIDPGMGLDIGTGGLFGAWGCWESTCCAQWGRCCLPTPRGVRCWTCCVREEKCTRCIWPW